MANNASAKKCIRQSERHRLHNRYYAKTTRNAIRDIRTTTDKKARLREFAFGHRDVAQLVAHYVRDVGVARSSRVIPTT